MTTENEFAERVRDAAGRGATLRVRGGGSKDFYGQALEGDVLDTRAHSGIVTYEPTELFITARAGTPLDAIERELAQRGQMLGFEPPQFGGAATLGGVIAAGLSGPRRMHAGAVRDFVLGVRLVDGRGQVLGFGGRVMKNVAGYDVSRLLAGSLGTLALLLEVTLKVLPRPAREISVRLDCSQVDALQRMRGFAGRPLPISAACWQGGALRLRLSGAAAAVDAAARAIGGEPFAGDPWWRALRDQAHPFFAGAETLWRVSLPPATPPLAVDGDTLIEWNGGLRWLRGARDADRLRAQAILAGGHATLFRADAALKASVGTFQPLAPALLALHRRVKTALDPAGVFGRGRMYAGL